MKKRAIIIIGKSGSGKGTQSGYLIELLSKYQYEDVKHITTGGVFREFIEGDTYTARLIKEKVISGSLAPEFAAIWNWSNIFMQTIRSNTSFVLDGAPRKIVEVEPLRSALMFYGYENPIVIYLEVSDGWSEQRLKERGRKDDISSEERAKKMYWFATDVLPCVQHYKDNSLYTFIRINGEQSIEKVREDIKEKITPYL